jgi:polyisoprenoid-binding protein YceI
MTLVAPTYTDLTGTYTLDPAHTRIGFVARHAMVTKVRGAFNDFEGTIQIDGAEPAKSSAKVAIKAASIDTRNSQRDDHIRSADFLELETYPEITFVSRGIAQTGDLTVKDVTRPLTIEFEYEGTATDPFGNERIGFEGSVTVSRKEFGITWNAALETGGVLVGDKIVLEFEVSAIKSA